MAVVAAVTVVVTVAVGVATDASAAPAHLEIVAFGDSYTAGNGAGSYFRPDTGCHRSGVAYAELLAARLRTGGARVAVRNVACSGARIADLTRSVATRDGTVLPAQLDQVPAAVARRADLVLLSVGGNDLGFADVVRCLLELPVATGCDPFLAGRRAAIPGVTRATRAALLAVGRRLPGARVVLVGYPSLVQPACAMSARNAVIDAGQRDVEAAQAALVAGLPGRFRFVSLRRTFSGHGPCAQPGRQFVHNLVLLPFFETFHPNRAGHEATADLLLRALGPALSALSRSG